MNETTAEPAEVIDHPDRSRFEILVDGHIAFAAYRLDGDVMALTHTIVPNALAGHGVGTRLIAGMLKQVRARHLKIIPECSFVVAYLQKHPEEADLVAN
ncbi:GNAT family N-acetyltransferase [Sphingomonas sp. BIUV-7]|uniref:GNAT family N-acetyltransferase n=1 Tax=Sphingomonas natans TaxID=3063330 RepID=A0ABT8YB16_9SPHN|nr:GNAT family N-acetyltransferase [Sphingomonas sp. BIUV-7]MDO6415534.1 GNAT family N-acetyltransferase [Sphingomonas sp. BIUV-7]